MLNETKREDDIKNGLKIRQFPKVNLNNIKKKNLEIKEYK